MAKAYVQAIRRMAYIWGWPLSMPSAARHDRAYKTTPGPAGTTDPEPDR
jgi:hypothetical protein